MEQRVYTVSNLTRQVKEILEQSFPRIWLEGEISNFKRHSSGHLYLTIKDAESQVRCAMWRFKANSLVFQPADGMQVLVEGDVQVYEKGGYYQLIIQQMQPAGVGALQLAFEQLKRKLHAEGLFDSIHKKPLSPFPEAIGVITSPTGAALRDIISVIRRRQPGVKIVVIPVRVQGKGAANEIADAISDANRYGELDVLIVGRGGGSLEDLWAFNEEIVARAIHASALPIISAVGHEVDFSIADFVADQRAPTPSAAAEIAVRDRQELASQLNYWREKLPGALTHRIGYLQEKIQSIYNGYAFRQPQDKIYQQLQYLDDMQRQLTRSVDHKLTLRQNQLEHFRQHLDGMNPQHVLKRGYSIVTKGGGGIVRDSKDLEIGDRINVQLANSQFDAQVLTKGKKDGE